MKLDINKPIKYDASSHRHFWVGERHVTRVCDKSVLLLVYDGILRFGEGEEQIEVKSGEYYIQRAGLAQNGAIPSDSPKYYYIHFDGEFTHEEGLALRGEWQTDRIMPLLDGMEGNADSGRNLLQKSLSFYNVLDELSKQCERSKDPLAENIMSLIMSGYRDKLSVSDLAKKLYISENYLIRVFKKEYGVTPYSYIMGLRLEKAKELLRETSRGEEDIALSVGFSEFSAFYKAFCKKYGYTPSRVRK